MPGTLLFNQVVGIINEFLGPASERFVERMVNVHLKKEPSQLESKDIPKLMEWMKVSLGLLTPDKESLDECEKKVLKLAKIT